MPICYTYTPRKPGVGPLESWALGGRPSRPAPGPDLFHEILFFSLLIVSAKLMIFNIIKFFMKFSLRLRINNLMSPATHDRHWRLRSHLSLERVTTRARIGGEENTRTPHARGGGDEATRAGARAASRASRACGAGACGGAGAGARDPRRGAGTGSLCSPAAVLVTAGRVAPPAGTHPEQQVDRKSVV